MKRWEASASGSSTRKPAGTIIAGLDHVYNLSSKMHSSERLDSVDMLQSRIFITMRRKHTPPVLQNLSPQNKATDKIFGG
jgi:hypothetical protein